MLNPVVHPRSVILPALEFILSFNYVTTIVLIAFVVGLIFLLVRGHR